jgi:IclR family transcriptional regulator, KDG regulon repressor
MPGEIATNSLERALLLLELVARKPGGLSHAEIRRQLHIPKSSCTYILTRLEREAYLTRDPESGRYKIGLNTLSLAHDAMYGVRFRAVTEPELYKLASETGLAASCGVLNRGRVLLVDRVEGPLFVRHAVARGGGEQKAGSPPPMAGAFPRREQRDIGRELPAHSTALGRVLLAHLPKQEMIAFIRSQKLVKYTQRTIDTEGALLQELALVRQQGYSMVEDEYYHGICAISTPVMDRNGQIQAAISVSGSQSLKIWDDPRDLIERLRSASYTIARRLPT